MGWISSVHPKMAHLKVLDCMINNNWSLICDLYCAWNNQVSLLLFLIIRLLTDVTCSRLSCTELGLIHSLTRLDALQVFLPVDFGDPFLTFLRASLPSCSQQFSWKSIRDMSCINSLHSFSSAMWNWRLWSVRHADLWMSLLSESVPHAASAGT